MPHLAVPEDTFRRLTAKAASLGISVEDLVRPVLDQLGEASVSPLEPQPPLTEDAWFPGLTILDPALLVRSAAPPSAAP